ncbi:MAG: phycobilisome rod-core linker polypeptide [Geitlerinemataceae cyanobacterium]
MALPLLNYTPASQNARVAGYEIAGDEQPVIFDAENIMSGVEMKEVIWAAYRQVFSEHQILKSNRQKMLESQLCDGRISVRQFIRGLATSDPFLRRNFQTNSNYRFVDMCVQRLLGRDTYNKQESIAWSIVIATKGVNAFIDQLLESDEYLANFGDSIVPYQRRRSLPQREMGEMPFNLKTPRYGAYHRGQLGFPQIVWDISKMRRIKPQTSTAMKGCPDQFIGMARALTAAVRPGSIKTVPESIDYMAMVPRR